MNKFIEQLWHELENSWPCPSLVDGLWVPGQLYYNSEEDSKHSEGLNTWEVSANFLLLILCSEGETIV